MSPGPDDHDPQIELPGLEVPTPNDAPTPQPPTPTAPRRRARRQTPWFDDPKFANRLVDVFTHGADLNDPNTQMVVAYGPSPRDPARPDTATMAKRLGVSRRTVQRWLQTGNIPAARQPLIRRQARRALQTQKGRRNLFAGHDLTPPKNRNGLKITGLQGIPSGELGLTRPRTTNVRLSPTDLDELQAAYEAGGNEAAVEALARLWGDHYASGWEFHNITDIDWTTSANYEFRSDWTD